VDKLRRTFPARAEGSCGRDKVAAGLPAWFGGVGSGEALPIRPTVGRVCPAEKEAWMLMEVNAGLPAWFGGVGVARRSQSRRVILRWCLGGMRSHPRRTHPPYGWPIGCVRRKKGLDADGGSRRITRRVCERWEWRGVPNPAGNSAVVFGGNSVSLAQNTPALRP
jgi:hypothetical protein